MFNLVPPSLQAFRISVSIIVVLLVACLSMGIMINNTQHAVEVANLKLSLETQKLEEANGKLSSVAEQREELEAELKASKEALLSVRPKVITRVKEIMREAPPASCEDVRKYLIKKGTE